VTSRYPRLGPALLKVTNEPQSSKAWATGAAGERLVGERLDALKAQGVVALHDRRRPGSRANIDHIAVSPTGVYVIDAKRYAGRIERSDVGGWFRADVRLYVAGRDRSKLVEGVTEQAAVVRSILGAEFADVAVRGMLCFVDPDVGAFARPFEIDEVTITWPRAMQKQVGTAGPLDEPRIASVATRLSEHLRPA